MLLPAKAFGLQRVELEGEVCDELVSRLSQEFKCPVLTHAEVSRAVFDAQHLQGGLRFADPVTAELSRQACERELQSLGLSAATKPVRDYLVGADGSLRSPTEMATEIGVSTRTVHRMLAADGLKYADLADQVRIEQAPRLLRRGLSTDAVAEALDYSDARSFRRAFERWTGETPARFRERR
jgi:AraC-like DNA-binding protein